MDITSPVSTPAPAASVPVNINSTPSSAPLPPKPSTTLPDQDISLDFDNDSTSFDVNKTAPKAEKAVEAPETTETNDTTTTEEADPFDLPKDVSEAIKSTKPKETPVETQKPEASQNQTTQQGRDYSNLPDEVVSVLKKLPNQTYNAVREQLPKWYDAFKKQSEIPKYFTQHPEAYKLDTGYSQVQNELETDRFEVGALKDAIVNLKQNKPFELLTGYDEEGAPVFKTVNPDRSGKFDPSIELELTEAYRRAQGNYEKSFQGFKSYPDRFQAKIKEEREFINQSFKKIFKDIDPEKFTPEEKNYAPLLEKIIPDSVTAEDARRIAHYAMIGNLRMAKAFQSYIEQQKTKPLAAPAPQAGPMGKSVGGDDIPLSDKDMFGDD
jgi:hypothetical protein